MSVTALTAEPLAEHRHLLPLVEHWFVTEWPNWYGPAGQGNIAADLEAFAASEHQLPVGMVVFESGIPIAAGALKAESIPTHMHLSPWAGAGFVLPQHRGKGVGSILLAALVTKARELGHECVYCGTSTAESLLVRAGWSVIAVTQLEGKNLSIFRSAA